MKTYFLYISVALFLVNCSSTRQFSEQENQAYQDLQELVSSRSLEIISRSASPVASAAFTRVANSNILGPGNNANRIDISANGNYVRIKGDSIQGFLPFFGEQNFGSSYGSNHNGIEFKGIPENYEVIPNDKKHFIEIKFGIDDQYRKSDHYDVKITLFPNKQSSIRIISTARSSIEYLGRWNAWQEIKD